MDNENKEPAFFRLGKCYRHTTGREMYVCGVAFTTMYGIALVAEDSYGDLEPIGQHSDATTGWSEITRDEWMENFSE